MHRTRMIAALTIAVLAMLPAAARATADGEDNAGTEEDKAAGQSVVAVEASAGSDVAFFRLDGEIPEVAEEFSLFSAKRPATLEKWLRRLAKARNDENVRAVVLEVVSVQGGWAQVQELRSAIQRIRDAGKTVHCYLADGDLKSYVLASACDKVTMAPAGYLMVTGFNLQMWMYKNLLDKLGIEADILHVGAYKGAGEPYTRTEPSDEVKQDMTRMVDSLYEQAVEGIAEARGLQPEEVRRLIDVGLFSPSEAVEAKLIDGVMQMDELLESVKDEYGGQILKEYASKSKDAMAEMNNPFAIFKMFSQSSRASEPTDQPTIGLIMLSGTIVDRSAESPFATGTVSPEDISKAVDEALKDDNIKAVVLRIDSPGGSSLASDIMYSHIRRLADAKPVIVSMGNVAASGGYYVASAAPTIIADGGTITGSIGVLGGKPVLAGLFEKIGITTWTLQRGKMAGAFDLTEPFSPAQRERVKGLMTAIYRQFLDRVLATRREKLTQPIEDLAGGRVYTGAAALEVGLVDKLGGMTEAVYMAAEQAGAEGYDIRVIPKPQNFFEVLMENMFTDMDAESAALSRYAAQMLPGLADPTAAAVRRVVNRALLRVQMLRRESVLMMMPYDTNLVP